MAARRCRKNGGKIAGIALMAVGGLVVLCFVPAWIWVLLLGLALIVAGVLLLFMR